jgi:N-acetylglucosaminyl-diphospho-decaprenol L-rhamnosyltransferase
MAADLSVIVVNYRAGALLADAVASIRRQRFRVDGREGVAEAVVVDNASGPVDEPFLDALGPDARVLRSERNLGFGAACNRGLEVAAGERICFLNPDARLQAGAVAALLDALDSSPDVAAVGPALWVDDDRSLRAPPNHLPGLAHLMAQSLAVSFPRLGQRMTRSWTRSALRHWAATRPLEVPMLSGACVLMRRRALEVVGSFDEGFFMYYEDADWCRRARAAGLRLLYAPQAHAVHYYNQSAKGAAGEAAAWARASEARYVGKHFGPVSRRLLAAVRHLESRGRPGARVPMPVTDLGSLSEPPLLEAPGSEPARFEFAYHWLFMPAVAAFPAVTAFRLPCPVWSRLLPTRYFARAVSPRSGAARATWTWVKQA